MTCYCRHVLFYNILNIFMKNRTDFIKNFVNISFIEDHNAFGHYPFSMLSQKDDSLNISALAIGGYDAVRKCYYRFCEEIRNGNDIVFMALDFPQQEGFEYDFLGIYEYNCKSKEFKISALPYNTLNGETFDLIEEVENDFLKELRKDFYHIFNKSFSAIVVNS